MHTAHYKCSMMIMSTVVPHVYGKNIALKSINLIGLGSQMYMPWKL